METCFYCGKELDVIYDEPISGYDCGLAVIACKNCAESEENFKRTNPNIVFKRFAIQYVKEDPSIICSEFIVTDNLFSAIEYAQNKYLKHELLGVSFDAYVNANDDELTYDAKAKCFILEKG